MRKNKFIIEIKIPIGCNITDMENYIHSSVATMCGSLHPIEDPLFDIDRDSIKVVHATRSKRAQLLGEVLP